MRIRGRMIHAWSCFCSGTPLMDTCRTGQLMLQLNSGHIQKRTCLLVVLLQGRSGSDCRESRLGRPQGHFPVLPGPLLPKAAARRPAQAAREIAAGFPCRRRTF